ncbi:metallopeptidase family protein [Haliangium sp.]|uniref:metallopeptidase family protein n=1 Tax=Haliangium sp. TaxID=2663208 RepID=UPI003D113FCF
MARVGPHLLVLAGAALGFGLGVVVTARLTAPSPAGPGADGALAEAEAIPAHALGGPTPGTAGEGAAESMPFADCPLGPEQRLEIDLLLDTAAERYHAGELASAYACAVLAAELAPGSIDAHHLRAVAASALGRHDDARSAYALALVLDPDDPETLAAAADFYINLLVPKQREATLLGLEYARRGRARMLARRRRQPPLRARLALLEAQAFNDLGQAEQALPRLADAIATMPDLVEARYERGVALFNACRFEAARAAFEQVLVRLPEDAYTHHHLGLVYEWLGQDDRAEHHLARARSLAPAVFRDPILLAPGEFQAVLDRAVAELPPELSALLDGVAVAAADLPERADLLAVDPPFSPTILGLFRGLPLGADHTQRTGRVPPRAIVLYRKNLARAVGSRAELEAQIRRTLLHEIGHLQGLDELDLRLRGLD